MSVHDTQNPESRETAVAVATEAVRDGKLIVLPTDTVYGIGADAFTPDAVSALLEAKGRGRDVPPPVLVGDHAVLLALAVDVPDYVEQLAEEFWPGPLTLILKSQPSLTWDLGETRGTVALRMPDDEIALELLRSTGPLAVSSANRHGKPAALTVLDAATQFGDAVEEYLDGGPSRTGTGSTIIDTTVEPAEIVREGAVTAEQIVALVGDIFTAPAPEEPEDGPDTAEDSSDSDSDSDSDVDSDSDAQQVADVEATDPTDAAAPDADADLDADTGTGTGTGTAAAAPADGSLDLPSEPDLVELSTTPAHDPAHPVEPVEALEAAEAVEPAEPVAAGEAEVPAAPVSSPTTAAPPEGRDGPGSGDTAG